MSTTRPDRVRLGLVSLGCDKNTVDSERMLAALVGHGAERVTDLETADLILVNTCGFIDAAKEESIETLIEAGRLKREGNCRSVVAVGCMVERYRDELEPALPEVDLLVGLRDLDRLVPELVERGLLPRTAPEGVHPGERLPLGSRHVAYLKVSEGCDHGCAFCAIPLWRGRHRSFDPARILEETRRLEARGAVEINLVAQDLAHYGREFRDGTDLSTLLDALLAETGVPWFRLLYIYSAGLRESLARLMAREPRLLSYIDMPVQHASDAVLRRMRRPERNERLRRKVAWLRETIPDVTLRTTVLVGFPGETEEDFRELVEFLEEIRFDRVGAFAFSPQEGTRAAGMRDEYVAGDIARARLEEVLEVQRAVSAERLARRIGSEAEAIIDGVAGIDEPVAEDLRLDVAGLAPGERLYTGRIAAQADDVDGITLLSGPDGLAPGTLVRVRLDRASDFDLAGRVEAVVRRAPAAAPASAADVPAVSGPRGGDSPARAPGPDAPADGGSGARALPVLGLESAWGR